MLGDSVERTQQLMRDQQDLVTTQKAQIDAYAVQGAEQAAKLLDCERLIQQQDETIGRLNAEKSKHASEVQALQHAVEVEQLRLGQVQSSADQATRDLGLAQEQARQASRFAAALEACESEVRQVRATLPDMESYAFFQGEVKRLEEHLQMKKREIESRDVQLAGHTESLDRFHQIIAQRDSRIEELAGALADKDAEAQQHQVSDVFLVGVDGGLGYLSLSGRWEWGE